MAAFRPGLSVDVLGPLEVRRDGQALRLKGKEGALVALLALEANRTVSVDRLIEGLWGDEPPASAQNMLHVYVSRLRRLFEPELEGGARSSVLVRHGAGYELRLAAGQIDHARFERLTAEARGAADPAVALARLEEALALWRGDALADLANEPFAQREIARLEELRLAAVEDRIDAELTLGPRHAALVGELEHLVAAHPLRERLRAQLMLALYRSGRQADALAAFQDARHVLVDELGIEPGAALRKLERAILRQDPALEVEGAPEPAVAAPVESRKVVTAVFVELVAPPLDPEALRGVLADAAAAAAAVLERYGASVERGVADHVVGVFGVPTLHEDDAVRALRAAEELRETAALPVRIALATGETLAGARPLAEALLGLRPARMPEAGDIAVDAATRRLAAQRPVSVVPLVGRDDDLRQLRSAYERALRDRTAYLFTLLGAAGIGKSRLAEELAAQAADARVIRARCLPYGAAALAPIAELVDQAADEEVAALLASGASRDDTFVAVRKLLATLARRRPLIVVLDDVHWAEPTLLDLVDHVADLVRDAPLLLLCLARDELLDRRPSWGGGKRNATSLLLQPLNEQESERLVEALVAESELPDATRARVTAAAEGNPLFIEQLLAAVGEGEETIPPTISALLAARVDRLAGAERSVLQAAAVVGKEFAPAAVAALVPDAALELEHALDGLVRKELVRPAGDVYRFGHMLIRDAAYGLIPKAVRVLLHERSAQQLGESDELVGYHLEQAHVYAAQLGSDRAPELAELAADRLAAAARRAHGRGEDASAAALWARTVALLRPDAQERVAALIAMSESARYAGGLERAEAAAAEALAVARARGDRQGELHARVVDLRVRLRTDPHALDEAPSEFERVIDELDERRDAAGLAHAYDALAEIAYLRCRAGDAETFAVSAIEFARRTDDLRTRARAETLLLGTALFGPLAVGDGVRRCETVLRDPPTARLAASALRALVGLRAMEGDFDEARRLRTRVEAAYADLGLLAPAAASAEVFAFAELLAGDPAAAERALLDASEAFTAIGDRSALSTMDAMLARAAARQGRDDDALALGERCATETAAGDIATQVQWRVATADVLVRRGANDEAEALAREAVELADRTDFPNLRADALTALAAVCSHEEARAALERALELYARKGNVVSAERVRRRLAAPAPA